MTLRQDPQQMVRYFSDFLKEINYIIGNIKHHAYQMIDVTIPTPTLLTVYQSMASIINATHKTYDNLKRIESVMSGMVKARRLEISEPPTTPINKFRSKSVESDIFYHPKKMEKGKAAKNAFTAVDIDSKTIKKSKILQNAKEEESGKLDKLIKNSSTQLEQQQDQKTIKLVKSTEPQSQPYQPMKGWKKIVIQRINNLINSNRTNMSKIMDKNMQCLRLVRSVKKQFKLNR